MMRDRLLILVLVLFFSSAIAGNIVVSAVPEKVDTLKGQTAYYEITIENTYSTESAYLGFKSLGYSEGISTAIVYDGKDLLPGESMIADFTVTSSQSQPHDTYSVLFAVFPIVNGGKMPPVLEEVLNNVSQVSCPENFFPCGPSCCDSLAGEICADTGSGLCVIPSGSTETTHEPGLLCEDYCIELFYLVGECHKYGLWECDNLDQFQWDVLFYEKQGEYECGSEEYCCCSSYEPETSSSTESIGGSVHSTVEATV